MKKGEKRVNTHEDEIELTDNELQYVTGGTGSGGNLPDWLKQLVKYSENGGSLPQTLSSSTAVPVTSTNTHGAGSNSQNSPTISTVNVPTTNTSSVQANPNSTNVSIIPVYISMGPVNNSSTTSTYASGDRTNNVAPISTSTVAPVVAPVIAPTTNNGLSSTTTSGNSPASGSGYSPTVASNGNNNGGSYSGSQSDMGGTFGDMGYSGTGM